MSAHPTDSAAYAGEAYPIDAKQLDAEKHLGEKHAAAITEDAVPRISPLLLNLFHIGAVVAIFASSLQAVVPSSFFVQAVEPWGVEVSSLWMLAAYLIGYVALVLPAARIGEVFGRLVTFWFGIVLFVVFSGVAGHAKSSLHFAILRAFQGAGAGIVSSAAVQVIAALNSERSRALRVGSLAAAQMFGIGAAHLIGGSLAIHAHFRWGIYMAAPLAAAPALLCSPALAKADQLLRTDESFWSRLRHYDFVGTLFLLGAATMLTTGLVFGGNEHRWSSATTLCLIIFGVVSIVLFLAWEAFGAGRPIFNTLWLRERNLQISVVGVLLIAMTIFAHCAYVPILYITVRSEPTNEAGRMTAPYWGASTVAAVLTGAVLHLRPRLARPLVWVGLPIAAVFWGLYYIIEEKPASLARERAFYVLAGAGTGLAYPAIIYLAQVSVPRNESGPAAAVAHFLSVVGGMLGLILYQACLKSRLITTLTPIFAQSTFLSTFDIRTMDIAGLEMSGETMLHYEPKLAVLIGQEMTNCLHTTFILSVPFLGAALLGSLLYKHHHHHAN